jgi:hypothetical protein
MGLVLNIDNIVLKGEQRQVFVIRYGDKELQIRLYVTSNGKNLKAYFDGPADFQISRYLEENDLTSASGNHDRSPSSKG